MKNLILLILILLFTFTSLNAQEIKSVSLIRTNNKLYISAELDKNIPEEIFEYLHDGVRVTIVYTINIYKEKPIFDSEIKEILYKKKVEYSFRGKNYNLIDGKEKVIIFDKKEINKRLIMIKKVFLIEEKKLGDGKFYLEIKAALESVQLVPPFSWIIDLFGGVRKFETPWVEKKIK